VNFDDDELELPSHLYGRPELARHHLARLLERPDRALSLFGPRQIGKTTFLNGDLSIAARARGITPLYVDLMGSEHPLVAIVERFEEALADLDARPLRERVKGVSVLGVGLELEPAAAVPAAADAPAMLQRAFAALLRKAPGSRWLLMLDEVQELARVPRTGEPTLRALRALFNRHKVQGRLLLLMTGSSEAALAQLFASHAMPSFGLADREDFPPLGREYVRFVLARANAGRARGHRLDEERFLALFTGPLHSRPGDFEAFVGHVLTYNPGAPDAEIQRFLDRRYPKQELRQRFLGFTPLQRALLLALAQGRSKFTSREMLAALGRQIGLPGPVSGAAVRKAFLSLPANTLGNPARGRYVIEDPHLLGFLQAVREEAAAPADPPLPASASAPAPAPAPAQAPAGPPPLTSP
jgi:hypothetical protein